MYYINNSIYAISINGTYIFPNQVIESSYNPDMQRFVKITEEEYKAIKGIKKVVAEDEKIEKASIPTPEELKEIDVPQDAEEITNQEAEQLQQNALVKVEDSTESNSENTESNSENTKDSTEDNSENTEDSNSENTERAEIEAKVEELKQAWMKARRADKKEEIQKQIKELQDKLG